METEPIGSQLQAKRGQNKRRVKVIFGWMKESEDKGWRRTEPESRTSATPRWKPKETHPAGIAQSPLYPCTAHTLPCDWMTRQGWRANWIALASIKGKEQNNGFKLLNRELSLKKERMITSHIQYQAGGWRNQSRRNHSLVLSHDRGSGSVQSEGGIRLHPQRFQQDYSRMLQKKKIN